MDLYLRSTSLAALKATLAAYITEENPFDGNLFETPEFVVDWIGKVPEIINEETGEVIKWFTYYRFNVRLLNESVTTFSGFTAYEPETPYRVFS